MQRALLIALVALSYLLVPGFVPGAPLILLFIGILAVLLTSRHAETFPRYARLLDGSLVAIVLLLALQLVPLPAAVISMLSPHAALLRYELRIALDGAAAWQTLSIVPAATASALATTAVGALTFVAARALFSEGGHTRGFCRALSAIVAILTVAAAVQRSVTPKLLLGVFEPAARSTAPFGGFTNRNHFAAWVLMSFSLTAGYLFARLRTHPAYLEPSWRRAFREFLKSGALLTLIEAAVMIGVMLMTLSRSAVIAAAGAAFVAYRLGRPRLRATIVRVPVIVTVVIVGLLAAVLFIDIPGWMTRLTETLGRSESGAFSRTTIWRESLPVIRDFWLTGTGGGTYSDAMVVYQQSRVWVPAMQRWAHFNNAHSHYVQVGVEGGLLMVVLALTAGVALLRLTRAALRAEKGELFWIRLGASAGLVGLAVQSIWEVSLTTPANAVMAGILGGFAVHRRGASQAHRDP